MFRVGKEDIVVCAGFQHQSKLIKKTLWSLQFAAHVFQVLFQKLVSVFSKFSELYTAMSPMAIYRELSGNVMDLLFHLMLLKNYTAGRT